MLEIANITKNFDGVKALNNVSAKFYEGEINGLVGENGAGKSTLMKIISGVHKPTAGKIFMDEKEVSFDTPAKAYNAGIRIVYQELSLIDSLSIAENIFIHKLREGKIFKIVKRKELEKKTNEILKKWGIEVKASEKIANVSMGIRQLIEIAREMVTEAKVVILDEPTSSLTNREIDQLFKVVKMLKDKGIILVFISHRLNEVISLADRITVLRDGEIIANSLVKDLTLKKICKLIAGEDIKKLYPKIKAEIGNKALEVKNFSGKGFNKISIDVRGGEIVGLAGLMGAGRSELLRAIFGLNEQKGDLYVEGEKIKIKSASKAVRKGIALLGENRTEEGIFPNITVAKNIVMLRIKNVVKYGFLNLSLIIKLSKKMTKKLNIISHNPIKQVISELSGGNQQKVIFARILALKPRILLLDEPTRGVDIAAKTEIHKIMGNFVKEGGAILLASSELDEIIEICDRAYVLHEGELIAEINRENFNKEDMLKCMMGLRTMI